MKEKRKEERRILTTFTPVYNNENDSLLGYLRDLTMLGAMLVGSKPMEARHEVTLAIEFPETPELAATRLVIPTRVAWCLHEEHSDYYNTGLEFIKLKAKDKKVIEAILQRYQFRQEPPAYPGGWP